MMCLLFQAAYIYVYIYIYTVKVSQTPDYYYLLMLITMLHTLYVICGFFF
jgi:hypothetical protein